MEDSSQDNQKPETTIAVDTSSPFDESTKSEDENKHDVSVTIKEKGTGDGGTDVHIVVKEKVDEDKDSDEKKDTEKALLEENEREEESVRIDIQTGDEGEDTPTLPMPDKKKKDIGKEKGDKDKEKPPSKFLFPITRMKLAWNASSNILEFFVRAVCIIITSLGWLFCVGGLPLVSIVMLIIGSIFISDCPAQPNIPVYLVIAGLFGTFQHLTAVWTKYVPKDTGGIIGKRRRLCLCIDAILQLFLGIWFIAGCVWVYGLHEPDYNVELPNYCHKTVYLTAFWILNLSFIVLAILLAFSFCCILCIATTSKEKAVEQ